MPTSHLNAAPSTSPPEVWIVKGIVTDPSDYDDSHELPASKLCPLKIGDDEWRVYSYDPTDASGPELFSQHLTLETALAAHGGSIVHLVQEPPEDVILYERWAALRDVYSPTDILQRVRDAAYQQGILGTLLDAMEQS